MNEQLRAQKCDLAEFLETSQSSKIGGRRYTQSLQEGEDLFKHGDECSTDTAPFTVVVPPVASSR